jgi:hypothetical protein
MKKFICIVLICIFAFASCTKKEEKKAMLTNSKESDVSTEIVETPFSNPAIIYGTDFMSFMQSLRKIGDYDMLLKFTSNISIDKFGKEKIKTYYEEMFTNMSKLTLHDIPDISDNSDGSINMNYTNAVYATKNTTTIKVAIENDTCKLIIADINKKLLN